MAHCMFSCKKDKKGEISIHDIPKEEFKKFLKFLKREPEFLKQSGTPVTDFKIGPIRINLFSELY